MHLDLQFYSQTDITWEVALQASYVMNDAFHDTAIRVEYWPAHYDLRQIPRFAGYHQLIQVPLFRLVTLHDARRVYLMARENPRYGVILGRDPQTCESIAVATLVLPDYVPPFEDLTEIWMVRGIKNWFLKWVFRLQDIWAFKSRRNPLHSPEMAAEFRKGDIACNAVDTEERHNELVKMSTKELESTSYPKALTYYLSWLAVVTSHHGRGVGKQFLTGVIDLLKEKAQILGPPDIKGPPKLALFSAPVAVNFYRRFGFTLAGSVSSKLASGEVLDHNYFFLNLD